MDAVNIPELCGFCSRGFIYAPVIPIAWQASDLEMLGLATSAAPGSTAGLPGPTKNASKGGEMSQLSKVVIGVGIPLALATVVLSILFFLRIRRDKRFKSRDHKATPSLQEKGTSGSQTPPAELEDSRRKLAELENTQAPSATCPHCQSHPPAATTCHHNFPVEIDQRSIVHLIDSDAGRPRADVAELDTEPEALHDTDSLESSSDSKSIAVV